LRVFYYIKVGTFDSKIWSLRNDELYEFLDVACVVEMMNNNSEKIAFEVNRKQYSRYYLLADGIYSPWSCFVRSIHSLQDEKRPHYAKMQETTCKNVERCFGFLQARFPIIANLCKQ